MFETDLEIMKEHILSLRKYTKNMRILVVEDYEVLQKSLEKKKLLKSFLLFLMRWLKR